MKASALLKLTNKGRFVDARPEEIEIGRGALLLMPDGSIICTSPVVSAESRLDYAGHELTINTSSGHRYCVYTKPVAAHSCEKPTPTIKPAGHAHWVAGYECSNCHKRNFVRTNFCPNCGAKMKEETDED